MHNFSSFSPPPDNCRFNQMQKTYKILDEVLTFVVAAEPLIPAEKKTFTLEEAQRIANILGIDFSN